MIQAGYNPGAMVETMRILQELQTVRPIEFFSTHPNPDSRIAYLEERVNRRYAMFSELSDGREEYRQNVLDVLTPPRDHPGLADPNTSEEG